MNYQSQARVPLGMRLLLQLTNNPLLRYRLWNAEIIFRRTSLFILLSASLSILFFGLSFTAASLGVQYSPTLFVMRMLVLVAAFVPLRVLFNSFLENLFNERKYDVRIEGNDFRSKLGGIYDPVLLHSAIVQQINSVLPTDKLILFTTDEEGNLIASANHGDLPSNLSLETSLDSGVNERMNQRDAFSPGEVEGSLYLLQSFGIELLVPIVSHNKSRGLLAVGKKQSGSIFSFTEVKLLSEFAESTGFLLYQSDQHLTQVETRIDNEMTQTTPQENIHEQLSASLSRLSLITDLSVDESRMLHDELKSMDIEAVELIDTLNEELWLSNPEYDNCTSMFQFVRNHAREVFAGTDVFTVFQYPASIPSTPIHSDTRKYLLRAVKEILTNSKLHAAADRIELRLEFSHDKSSFRLFISDNGFGFRQHPFSESAGIARAKNHLEKIGGNLQMFSERKRGTVAILEGKL